MKVKKIFRSFLKNSIVSSVILSTILGTMGPFIFSPQTALAVAPNINHWSVWQADGDASATTTVYAHASVGDDTATPGGTPALTVSTVYKGASDWGYWASSTCYSEYDNTNKFRCPLPMIGGTDARTYKYYIAANDGAEDSYMSWATDTDNIANARSYPMQTTVYNAPSWTNGVSAQVMDGRQYYFSRAIAAATSTIYIASTTASTNNLAVNDWIALKSTTGLSEPKVQILSITNIEQTVEYQIGISGYTPHTFSTSDYVQEFLNNALVWVDGTTAYGTTTAQQATSTFGGISLYNIPNGGFDVVAFKQGYGEHRIHNIHLSGTSTSTLNFILSFGGFEGGRNLTGAHVTWSVPFDNTMGAPANIAINQQPILIAFSENASSSTITKNNIKLQTATAGGTFADFASYYAVAYEAKDSTVSIGGTDYDFGPDAKAIIYSTTTLATSTGYVVKLNSNVKDVNNNSIQGNDPAGGYTLFFSTSGGFFSSGGITGGTGGNFGTGGSYMPPFVLNAMPNSGSMSVARNTKIAIQFDQAMSASSLSGNVELITLSSTYQEGASVAFSAVLADSDKSLLIITPSSNLSASTRYKVKLLGGLQSSSGVSMAPPGSGSMKMFEMEFETGSSADTSVPTILATGLDKYLAGTSYTGIPVSTILKASFSESIDPTTINTVNLYLRTKGSTSNLSATAKYDIMEGKAILAPSTALNATTTYILTLTGYIKDFTGAQNALATTTYEFTTAGADATGPVLAYFNADDYSISLTFDEPMNATKVTDTSTWPSGSTKWQTSVLNSANYMVYVANGAPPTGATAKYYSSDNLASTTAPSVTLTYDSLNKTVKIVGMKLLADPSGVRGGVRIWVKNATDISGNVIQTNAGPDAEADNFGSNSMGGPVKNSTETFGMMGPGGGMFAPPTSVGTFTMTDFGGKNPAMMGMMPVGVWPMNMMAGATSTYMIDIPISSGKAIPASGKIVIGPFPDEAVVSLVKNADPNATFAHKDINGPGTGAVIISTAAETSGGANSDGVTVSGQTVTVILGSVATQAPDFLHLELDNIKNPTTPTQGGYKLSIQTQDSASTALESFTSMPFFIMPKGKYTIIGHVTTSDAGLNGVSVFGGSPSTGPLFTSSGNNAFSSSTDGEFKIEGLNSGNVMLMTEQSVTVGSDEYIASRPENIFIDDNTAANNSGAALAGVTGCTSATTCYVYKKITLTKVAAGTTPGLVVYIYGNFTTSTVMGFANLDIYAGGPNGFRVKQVSLNGDYSTTPYSTVFNLPSTGDYHVGIGPAMPKVMGKAAPPMPTGWMPPKPVEVSVSGSGGTWTWDERDSSSVGTSTADGLVKFTIGIADKTVSGYVYDTSGTAVSNVQVFAYSPTEFFGTGANTRNNGSFTLNVKAGTYKVGAFMPGAPPSSEVSLEVKSDGTFYVEGVLTTSLTFKLSKDIQSGYTISGTVYSDTSSQYPATDVSVYANRTDGPGRAETMTDSKGTYTLYVGTGTWKVGAFLGSFGKITEKTVTVPPSKSGLKLTPDTTTTYVTIRQRVWEDKDDDGVYDDGEGIARASVSVAASTTDYSNSAITDSSGVYEVKVPATTTYDIYVWSPDQGNLPFLKNKRVTSTDIIYTTFSSFAEFQTEQATTVEFGIYDSSGNSTTADKLLIQLDRTGVAGASNDVYKESVATTTMLIATSTSSYIIDIEIQGIPKELLTISPYTNTAITTTTVSTKRFATTTIDSYEKIKVILPPITFVSGQVRDENNTAIANAVLHIEQPGTDVEFDVEADSSGNYSFKVASSSNPYLIQADKGGYIDSAVPVYASTTSLTFNPSMATANNTIAGTVTINGTAPGGNDVYIWAEKLGGGYASTAKGDPQTGAYTLKVTSGNFTVHVVAEGYFEEGGRIVQTLTGNQTGVDFNINSPKTLQAQETSSMTGNVGGNLSDKESGFEMNIPRSTLSASDSSAYNVKHKEIANIPTFTPTGNLVGNTASEVSAYKPNGAGGNASVVSGLNGSAFVDKTFTKAQLTAEGVTSTDGVEEMKMGSYDASASNWTNLPTTITYLDSLDRPIIPANNLSNVSKVTFNGVTKHFSTFGVINTKYDGLAPLAPTSVTVSSLGNGQLQVSWTAVTTNSDGVTAATDIQRYNIYRSESSSETATWTKIGSVGSTVTSYTDTLSSGGVYYYRATADSGLASNFSGSSGGNSPSFSGSSGSSSSSSSGGGTITITPAPVPTPAPAPEQIAMAPVVVVPSAPVKKEITLEGITIPALGKPVAQMTKTELQAKIVEFLTVVKQLQELLTQLKAQEKVVIAGIPSGYAFGKILKFGQISDDIKYLQIILNSDPDTRIAESGVGSPSRETNYFGVLTKAAVIKFQEKYAQDILSFWGLTKGTGTVGSSTLKKMNELLTK